MIKHRLLLIGLLLILIKLVNNFSVALLIIILASLYYYFTYKIQVLFFITILLTFLMLISYTNKPHDLNYLGVVDSIKENNVVLKEKDQKVILYNVKGINLGDVIEYEGYYSKVVSTQNDNLFNYANYAMQEGINYSVNVSDYHVVGESNSIKSKLYRYINSLETNKKAVLLKIFYKYESDENYFIYASGFSLNFLILLLSKITKKQYHHISIITCIIYYLCFGSSLFLIRIFIFSLVETLFKKLNAKNRVGTSIIACLFINSNLIYNIGFVYSLAFHLFSLFNLNKSFITLKRLVLMIPLQLLFFNKVNILMLLLFNYLRVVSGLTLTLSILTLFVPLVNYFLNILLYMQDSLFNIFNLSYKLIGKPGFWWFVLYLDCFLMLISNKHLNKLLFAILMFYQFNMANLNLMGEVSFIDVGQGDCILINEALNGEIILIDAAGKINHNNAKGIIYPFLESKGIKTIDIAILTHDDYDHDGAIDELKKMIKIKDIKREVKSFETKDSKFTNLNSGNYKDSNDNSIVLFASLKGLNFLFTGDASKVVEKDIMDKYNKLKIDVLKVSHHGSNTASDPDFINLINPKVGIISAGANNSYGHPHKETIDTLKQNKCYILSTINQGNINVYYSNYFNYFKTNKNNYGKIK